MSSSKDTFESATFLADTFACGNWRGLGVEIAVVVSERFTLDGTDNTRLAISGTNNSRLAVDGTDNTRLTILGTHVVA